MVTSVQLQEAIPIQNRIDALNKAIADLEAVITVNNTIMSVTVRFDGVAAPFVINSSLNTADSKALLTAGLTILQGYLTAAEAALSAI